MKKNYEDKSNAELAIEINQLKYNHEDIKKDILKLYDLLEETEDMFNQANAELHKRITCKELK